MTPSPRNVSSKISTLVSDVDGTLVTDDKVSTTRTQAAVAKLHACGVKFAIVSSRPPRGLDMLLRPLGITTPVCGFNGGVIATRNLAVITEHLLSPDAARRAVSLLDAHDVQVWVFSGQDWLVRDPDGPYVGFEERTVGFQPTLVGNFGQSLDAANKIVGVSKEFEILGKLDQDWRDHFSQANSPIRSTAEDEERRLRDEEQRRLDEAHAKAEAERAAFEQLKEENPEAYAPHEPEPEPSDVEGQDGGTAGASEQNPAQQSAPRTGGGSTDQESDN